MGFVEGYYGVHLWRAASVTCSAGTAAQTQNKHKIPQNLCCVWRQERIPVVLHRIEAPRTDKLGYILSWADCTLVSTVMTTLSQPFATWHSAKLHTSRCNIAHAANGALAWHHIIFVHMQCNTLQPMYSCRMCMLNSLQNFSSDSFEISKPDAFSNKPYTNQVMHSRDILQETYCRQHIAENILQLIEIAHQRHLLRRQLEQHHQLPASLLR